eukprot:278406-Amphidinium_carterae.2
MCVCSKTSLLATESGAQTPFMEWGFLHNCKEHVDTCDISAVMHSAGSCEVARHYETLLPEQFIVYAEQAVFCNSTTKYHIRSTPKCETSCICHHKNTVSKKDTPGRLSHPTLQVLCAACSPRTVYN